MKLGYGKSRDDAEARALPEALRKAGAERVYVDTRKSYPAERDALFEDLREGDCVLLLKRAHLGVGREIPRLEAIIADRGCAIEIPEPEPAIPRKPGPAPRFSPDYEQERVCRHYWHGPFRRRDAVAKCSEVMGQTVTANSLNRHLGPRSKPSPWINSKEGQK